MRLNKFYLFACLFIALFVTGILIYNSEGRTKKEQSEKELDILRVRIKYDSILLEDRLR